MRAVSGEADLTVLGWAGALDEGLLDDVLAVRGVRAAIPLWRAEVALDGAPGEGLEVVGADLLAALRVAVAAPEGRAPATRWRAAGWVAVTPALAAEKGWREGSRIEVSLGSRRATLVVGALVDFQKLAPLASRRLAVMDLAQAQGLLGTRGKIHADRRGRRARRPGGGPLRARRGTARRPRARDDPRAAHRRGGGAPRGVPPQPHRALARFAPRRRLPGPRLGARVAGAAARGAGRPARRGRDARAGARAGARGDARSSARSGRRSGSRSAGSPRARTSRR